MKIAPYFVFLGMTHYLYLNTYSGCVIMKRIEMIGKRFGMLEVVSFHSSTRNGVLRYTCKCDCGKMSNVLASHLRQGNTKSCGCNMVKIGARHADWNGIGQISGAFWFNHVVKSANGSKGRRVISLEITKEYAWNLFQKQDGKCKLTAIELKFPERHKDKNWTASLDRIDSSMGYIEGNVQWVHKDINMMKRTYSQDYFIKMCKLVADGCVVV